jgi:unsaturated rhamnogalacturonyl hydrolase
MTLTTMSVGDLNSQAQERFESLLPALLTIQRASWEQGNAAQAILEYHQSPLTWFSKDLALRYLYGFAHDALVRQGSDGRFATVLNGSGDTDRGAVDPACIGETFYYLLDLQIANGTLFSADTDDASRFSVAVQYMLRYLVDNSPRAPVHPDRTSPANILLSHRTDCVQIWSDAVYMLPPFLASSAVYYLRNPEPLFDSARLLAMSLRQVILASQALQAPSGEWSHMFDLETYTFKRQAFWGVGNGWVCGGIVRVFSTLANTLSDDDESRLANLLEEADIARSMEECYRILRLTLNGCMRHIRHDSLFHDILDDPTSFVETNLTQQLAYTIYRLLDLHLHSSIRIQRLLRLPALSQDTVADWEGLAARLHMAAIGKVDRWGFVRDVCGSPHFNKAGTAAEGQAWAILMELARARYITRRMA